MDNITCAQARVSHACARHCCAELRSPLSRSSSQIVKGKIVVCIPLFCVWWIKVMHIFGEVSRLFRVVSVCLFKIAHNVFDEWFIPKSFGLKEFLYVICSWIGIAAVLLDSFNRIENHKTIVFENYRFLCFHLRSGVWNLAQATSCSQ